ncbi:ras-related protein Rab-32-like protein [Dinothrombium tinctorium]|uniref:Ras-related protein Rab n=1 Tax=Dinothrombium tinctorium TaxID=1965070 RepID=A0A443RP28_9ACAR|nr:ras-related protein Rab-32-like protein [Dinothrombium tinctorium]
MWIRCRELIYSSINPVKSPQDTSKEFQLKILIIGEPYAGKTSFITRYVHQKFSDMYRATVGVDFALKIVQWNADTVIKLQLWDIAGQERFADMTRIFYKDGVGACIVTDISNPASFEKVIAWKRDLDKKVTNPDGSSVPCILLANKCDLLNEEEMKSCDFMNDFCVKHKFISWFFTSAKDNLNIDKSMEFLLNEVRKVENKLIESL